MKPIAFPFYTMRIEYTNGRIQDFMFQWKRISWLSNLFSKANKWIIINADSKFYKLTPKQIEEGLRSGKYSLFSQTMGAYCEEYTQYVLKDTISKNPKELQVYII